MSVCVKKDIYFIHNSQCPKVWDFITNHFFFFFCNPGHNQEKPYLIIWTFSTVGHLSKNDHVKLFIHRLWDVLADWGNNAENLREEITLENRKHQILLVSLYFLVKLVQLSELMKNCCITLETGFLQ